MQPHFETRTSEIGLYTANCLPKAAPVEARPFGNTGMRVGALGFGAAEIGFEHTPDRIVDTLLGTAMDLGINVIDSAAMYADSEEKIGRVLGKRRQQFLLFTKCGRCLPPRRSGPGLLVRASHRWQRALHKADAVEEMSWHPRALQWNIEQSLRRLKTDHIDLLQLHSCGVETLRRGEVLDVLYRARQAGKALHIGYSGDGPPAMYAIQCGLFESVQMSINVADQQTLDWAVPLARQKGLGVIAKRPIANGLWTCIQRPAPEHHRTYWERLQILGYDFLRGRAGFDTALRFTLSIPGVHTAIVGTTNPQHFGQNARYAASGRLEESQFAAIRAHWKSVAQPDWTSQL